LVSLARLLDPGGTCSELDAESLQVIVFNEGDRFVGLVVDEILDIVDDIVTIKQPSGAFGLLGSGVVGGKVTDFVDLEAILAAAKTTSARHLSAAPENRRTILLVHPSMIARGVMRSFLEMHGHDMLDSPNLEDAMQILQRTRVDLVLASIELARNTGDDLVRAIRGRVDLAPLPVIGLASDTRNIPRDTLFDICLATEDRAALLQFIQSLTQQELALAASEYDYAGSLS
jgi:two-component system chemotaxis sensor kinase CheA